MTDRYLKPIALVVYLIGALARVLYGLRDHPARHSVVSDALNILQGAGRLLSDQQSKWDTVWPPGEMILLATTSRVDPSLTLASVLQVALSLGVPWLIADVARQVSGPRAGWLALIASSLHVGYIHYVGFFLSESMFQALTACAIWLTSATVYLMEHKTRKNILAMSILSGVAWGLATLFRPNALPISLLLSCFLLCYAKIKKQQRPLIIGIGLAVGLALILAPAAHRCSALKGGFCPVSSNFAMNVALGQAGEHSGLTFKPADGVDASGWVPPALLMRGNKGLGHVPASIFDTRGVLQWVYERVSDDPARALKSVALNVKGSLGMHLWPGPHPRWSPLLSVGAWLFLLCVTLPALGGAALVLRACRSGARELEGLLALVGVAGVILLAAISLGEPRYRFPFDAWLIALAGRVASSPSPLEAPEGAPRESATPTRVLRWGVAGVVALFALILLPSLPPRAPLAARLPSLREHRASKQIHRRGDELTQLTPSGSPWNKGTVVLPCRSTCAELVVTWPRPQTGARLLISTDHNDSYRVLFLKNKEPLEQLDTTPHKGPKGMSARTLPIPPAARGFDELVVTPLYGDGYYSVGHVVVR